MRCGIDNAKQGQSNWKSVRLHLQFRERDTNGESNDSISTSQAGTTWTLCRCPEAENPQSVQPPYTVHRSNVGTATASTNQETHSANAENHITSLVGSLEITEYGDIQGYLAGHVSD